MGPNWTAVALGGAAVATLAAAVYFKYGSKKVRSFEDIHAVTRDELSKLLDEILAHSQDMQKLMKELHEEILQENLSFEKVCARVNAKAVPSPLEKHGLSVNRFSQLLSGHNGDAEIREKILQLTTVPQQSDILNNSTASENKGADSGLLEKYSVSDVVRVHEFMLNNLRDIVKSVETQSGSTLCTNPRLVTLAAQAFVGKLVQQEFGVTSEQLENLTTSYHTQLYNDERFADIGSELRHVLRRLTELCQSSN